MPFYFSNLVRWGVECRGLIDNLNKICYNVNIILTEKGVIIYEL